MELISKEMQPVAGTEGAYYRRKRLMRQLPIYDQDPSHCCTLSENETKLMEDFVKKYKSEALGVGEVALPGQGGTKSEGKQPAKNAPGSQEAVSTNGTLSDDTRKQEYVSTVWFSWKVSNNIAARISLLRKPLICIDMSLPLMLLFFSFCCSHGFYGLKDFIMVLFFPSQLLYTTLRPHLLQKQHRNKIVT